MRVLSIGKLRWILSLRDIFFFKRLLLCAPFPISENFIFLIPRLLSLPKFLFFTFLFFFSTIFLSLQFFPITEILFHLSSRLLMWISTMAILSFNPSIAFYSLETHTSFLGKIFLWVALQRGPTSHCISLSLFSRSVVSDSWRPHGL